MRRDLGRFANLIRRETLAELSHIGYGHFGGSLSIVEALAVLYGKEMNYRPGDPSWEGRDRFILSKGHAGPALYAALALVGFFPIERLRTLNANGTNLPSHPDRRQVPGVDMTTGSMGQGLSVAAGLAYGLRVAGSNARVYVMVGDGELNEGQCWEAAQFIAHRELTNLVVLIDENKRQLDGWTAEINRTFDFVDKFVAFGFDACQVNGQDVSEIDAALQRARCCKRPAAIVLDTTKGAGVDYVVNTPDNHHLRLNDAGKAAVAAAIASLDETGAA